MTLIIYVQIFYVILYISRPCASNTRYLWRHHSTLIVGFSLKNQAPAYKTM